MNILGIGRDKSQSAYFPGSHQMPEYEMEKGWGPTTPPGRAARPGSRQGSSGRPQHPLGLSFRLYIAFGTKTLSTRSKIHERVCSRRHLCPQIGRDLKLFPVPCWRREFTLEAFFIIMQASGVMREQFIFGLRIYVVARWLVLLLCAFMSRSCELRS